MIRALVSAAVRNPVAANLGMLVLIVCGLLVYGEMPREVFPDYSMGRIEIMAPFPGASPEDVERLVTLPLEEAVEGIEGIEELVSVSHEGIARVTITMSSAEDSARLLDDVRDAVRRASRDLPEQAEDPLVKELENIFPVIAVFVYGDAGEAELRRLTEFHRRRLEAIDGVNQIVTTGLREPRLWVEVDPLALERYGLTLEDVGRAVASRTQDAPLGSLETEGGSWLLRIDSELSVAEDLEDFPLVKRSDGAVVRLSQVATLFDTFERELTRARFNGRPCLHMRVNKSARGDMIDLAAKVREYVAAENERMPAGVALGTNSDLSVYVRNRLDVMQQSGALGGVLVLVALFCFLALRVALVTALGIPVAFLGGLLLAGSMGVTMNMITMFGMIVVLGMLVDDAIVVGENIYRLIEEGRSPADAAVEGTAQVGRPVIATILTSVAAFTPILMLEGETGNFLRPLPVVVSCCLLISLLEALMILPAHVAHWVPARKLAEGTEEGARRRWYEPLSDAYTRLLETSLRWRYATLALATSLALVVGAVGFYRIPFVFFDDFESKLFYVNLRLDAGSSLQETEEVAKQVEAMALALPGSELESVNTLLGVSAADVSSYQLGQNLAQVWVELREGSGRRMSLPQVVELMREGLSDLPPSVQGVEIDQPQSGPSGRAIELSVRGPDLEVLSEISTRIQAELGTFAGTRDIHDNLDAGKRELRVILNDRGRTLGFSEALLAGELRAAFEGNTYGHIRRGTDDVEVIVKHPEALRRDARALESMRVTLPGSSGVRVPLSSVADLVDGVSAAVISRESHERSVTVVADINKAQGNAAAITREISAHWEGIQGEYPGYSLTLKGDFEETQRALSGLYSACVVAMVLIYLILGTLFRSFTQPIVIMFIIPFAAIGMILGHGLMGVSITLLSLIGLLALVGVVVNDSLILVEFINWRRSEGDELQPALINAGRLRFRPILLTSVTTMLGLSPLTFFVSGDARFLQPMAISIFFGLAVSTLLILVLVPCAYAVLDDGLGWVYRPRKQLVRVLRESHMGA